MILLQQQSKLRKIWENHRNIWDRDDVPDYVRREIERSLRCRTEELGAEVYRSVSGQTRIVFHTCKSRACPTCGYWQTICWQREVATQLPEIPYAGIILTMPDALWGLLRENRHLIAALSALGAGVIADWAHERYQARVPILAVPHTFNPKLEFNVHLHVLAGRTGLSLPGSKTVEGIYYPVDVLRERWRSSVTGFLKRAVHDGSLRSKLKKDTLLKLLDYQLTRWWKVIVNYRAGKQQIVDYIARYLRRPPMAEYRLLPSNPGQVTFVYKNKREGNEVRTITVSVDQFVSRLCEQVPEYYRHGVRYFGLLAPRAKHTYYEAFLRCKVATSEISAQAKLGDIFPCVLRL